MVFENLTLFEVSLDGAQIGPRSIGRPDDADAAVVEVPAQDGRSRVAPLFVLGVMAGMLLLWRRSRRHDVEAEMHDEAEAELADAR